MRVERLAEDQVAKGVGIAGEDAHVGEALAAGRKQLRGNDQAPMTNQ